jgi:hypothetical protein
VWDNQRDARFSGLSLQPLFFDQPPTQLLCLKLVETASELPILNQDRPTTAGTPCRQLLAAIEASNLRVISLIRDKP